jgi:hypothetical protein
MLSFFYWVPFAVVDAIFTVKRDKSRGCTLRLRAVSVIKPQQKKRKKNQKQSSCDKKIFFFKDLKFVLRHGAVILY